MTTPHKHICFDCKIHPGNHECKKCKLRRCTMCMFLNAGLTSCVECFTDEKIVMLTSKCIKTTCNRHAWYHNMKDPNILLCYDHACQTGLEYFDYNYQCCTKNCPGTGVYFANDDHYCLKHVAGVRGAIKAKFKYTI